MVLSLNTLKSEGLQMDILFPYNAHPNFLSYFHISGFHTPIPCYLRFPRNDDDNNAHITFHLNLAQLSGKINISKISMLIIVSPFIVRGFVV